MKCVIVGMSEFARTLIQGLHLSDWEIIAIDKNPSRLDAVSDLANLCIGGDATLESLYKDHELEPIDALVAGVLNDFESQVLLVDLASKMRVKNIYAVAASDSRRRVLERIGAGTVLVPQQAAARFLSQRITLPQVDKYLELEDGIAIVEIVVPEKFIGKRLDEIGLRNKYRVNLIGIARKRDQNAKSRSFDTVPSPDTVFCEDDHLYIAGSDIDLARLL
jgi:trk system potassium uptake protein